jgi:phenylacetate-CoA ligase
MNFKDLAKNLPYPLKQGLKYVYGAIPPPIRYGKVFRETYAFLQESQWWSREQLEEYQLVQLSKLLQHVYENVPYYRRIFDERGLKPKDIQDFNDLQQLPYLTKEIVQNNLPDLVAQNFSQSKLQYATTGGSTGIPLGFYREKGVSSAKEWAFMLSQWNRIGFKNDDRCVVLRGAVVQSVSKYKFWEYDPLNKSLILSSYHMTDENLPKYIEKIREFKPKFIRAYPSTITILARFVEENNIASFSSIKAILCSSENLYSWQRELLETVFQCRVYSWYGHAEQAVLAGECEHSTYYHIFSEYGIVELIGKDGKPMKQEDELGEVVATGLFNFACPLIRYRTMDLATLANTKCKCGRNYPLLKKVEGRLQELIITGTGRLISMTAMNMHSDVFDNVKQFQFYQEKKGEVIFNIVKKDTYTERDTKYIRSELYKKLGDDVNVIIRFVDDIPRTQSGKYRFLIQKLPIEFGD